MYIFEKNYKMLNDLSLPWRNLLSDEFKADYFIKLQTFVDQQYELYTCYPPKHQIFNAFNSCSIDDLRIVIIGQDPYHGEGEANGLCFAVNDGVKIPPSLRNIFKEIALDFNTVFDSESGNLQRWAKQGVLLLNATLTVQKDNPGSHQRQGWETFTDAVIAKINAEKSNVVFLLWGNYAQKKGAKIDLNKHYVLTSGHPSPLSANQNKWFGNKHFSKTNDYLESVGKNEIIW